MIATTISKIILITTNIIAVINHYRHFITTIFLSLFIKYYKISCKANTLKIYNFFDLESSPIFFFVQMII